MKFSYLFYKIFLFINFSRQPTSQLKQPARQTVISTAFEIFTLSARDIVTQTNVKCEQWNSGTVEEQEQEGVCINDKLQKKKKKKKTTGKKSDRNQQRLINKSKEIITLVGSHS